MVGAAIGLVALVAIVLGVVLLKGSGSPSSAGINVDFAKLSGLQTGPPPWNNGTAGLPDRLQPLGLQQLSTEGSVLHIHQHLDLYVNGKKVLLPAQVGIYANTWLTELHTHDTTGVMHVESPTKRDFSLGQFFGVWGVKVTANCAGSECGKLSWWVNGVEQSGDPARLILNAHQEIAIVLGQPPHVVPKSYNFAAGE